MEKAPQNAEAPAFDGSQTLTSEEAGTIQKPNNWKYKSINIGPLHLPWYASPPTQLFLVSLVCFLCPGMFNAINGMGGGGLVDTKPSTDSNVAVYSTFAVVGFFAGSLTNKIGIRNALGLGGIGYSVYIGSYLSYNHHKSSGYSIAAGVLLGVCAGLLWTAQGALLMAYPPEKSKGKYISWFWMIFNLGAVIGCLIPLAQNIHTTTNEPVTDGTYIGFIVLTVIGAGLACVLVNAKDIIRQDGSRVILMKNPSWKTEILGLRDTFITDPYILFLFPMFFSSNWFYTYQFNGVNLPKFNTRTRALNNVLYYIMQIVGAFIFGYALDRQSISRRLRARICWAVLFVLTMVIWGGGYEFQKGYTREETERGDATPKDPSDDYPKMDWTSPGYVGPMFLYLFYGFYDAAWQTGVYWYMGALTNNGRKLANFAGFYKGIQSAGSAIIWRLDGLKRPFMGMFISCWVLLAASLIIASPLIFTKITDTTDLEEDLKFTDETIEDVVPQVAKSHAVSSEERSV